jgi:O-antigen/teichoic acid export membrane protein
MLYFRQILTMLVSLYTVRVVLETLGAEDYGIYNVVAGVVTMFGFLSGSMAAASQRFFAFELRRGDLEQLKRVFSIRLVIYALIALIVLLLAETIGLWFVSQKLLIPPESHGGGDMGYTILQQPHFCLWF